MFKLSSIKVSIDCSENKMSHPLLITFLAPNFFIFFKDFIKSSFVLMLIPESFVASLIFGVVIVAIVSIFFVNTLIASYFIRFFPDSRSKNWI